MGRPKKQHSCQCGVTDPTLFYKSQKSQCKECYKKQVAQRCADDPIAFEKQRKTARLWQDANIMRLRWISARARATKRNIEFTITLEDVIEMWINQSGRCGYSGLDMELKRGGCLGPATRSVSIDKINPAKGYTKDNTILCCASVNIMKNDLSVDEFVAMTKSIYEHMQKKGIDRMVNSG